MTAYEEYWDTLLEMWDNKALIEMLQDTCYTVTHVNQEYIKWVGGV